MNALDLSRATWRTSSRTNGSGNCVEVAALPGSTAIRDTKDRAGAVLVTDSVSWAGFLNTIKSGALDI